MEILVRIKFGLAMLTYLLSDRQEYGEVIHWYVNSAKRLC